MSYPLSSAVSAGQPTAVTHYNNLRLDSLYFGQAAADAVDLATLFNRYQQNLNMELLGTDRIRVVASPTATVELVIEGYPLQATANVDLSAGDKPSGGAATWYVFAVRSGSSTTFTITCNTSSTEYTNARRIGSFYWTGTAILESSIETEFSSFILDLLSYNPPLSTQGRLTLSTGQPLDPSDSSGATVYYTPFEGNVIDIYNGTDWTPYSFSEILLSFAGVATDTNNDIFAYVTGGAVALSKSAWASDTARTDAISLQDGRYVMTSAPEYLYLGTVRTSALSMIADSLTQRFLWNAYNRRPRRLFKGDASAQYGYNSATIRQANAAAANKVEIVNGLEDGWLELLTNAYILHLAYSGGASYIGVNSITVDGGDTYGRSYASPNDAADYQGGTHSAKLKHHPRIGYSYYAWLENRDVGTGNCYFGDGAEEINCIEGIIYG